MNQKEFDEVVNTTIQDIQKLLTVKGGEYAGSEDRLGNFKRGGELTGANPLQVLFIYLSKHYDAFATYVRDQAIGKDRPRSESITGRLDDIINYCILAKALVRELEQSKQPAQIVKQSVVKIRKIADMGKIYQSNVHGVDVMWYLRKTDNAIMVRKMHSYKEEVPMVVATLEVGENAFYVDKIETYLNAQREFIYALES